MAITLKPTVASRRARLIHDKKVRQRGEVVTFRGRQEMAFVYSVPGALAGTFTLSHVDRGALIASAHALAFEFRPMRWAPYSSDPVPAPGEYVFRRDGTEPHLLTDDKIPGQRDINTSVTVIGYRDIFHKPATGMTTGSTTGGNGSMPVTATIVRQLTAGGVTVGISESVPNPDGGWGQEVSIPAGATDVQVNIPTVTVADLQAYGFDVDTGQLAVKLNNATTPGQTAFTLKQNSHPPFKKGDASAGWLTVATLSSAYLSNPGSTPVKFRVAFVLDTTPTL